MAPRKTNKSAPSTGDNELPMSAGNRHPFHKDATLDGLLTADMSALLSAEQKADLLCLAGKGQYRAHPRTFTNNPYAVVLTTVQVQCIAKQEGAGRKIVEAGVESQMRGVLQSIVDMGGSKVAIASVKFVSEEKHFIEFSVRSTGRLTELMRSAENETYNVIVDRLGAYSFGKEDEESLERYERTLLALPQKARHYFADRLPVKRLRIKVPRGQE